MPLTGGCNSGRVFGPYRYFLSKLPYEIAI
ncbi:hypothetical protein [Klebsiella phage vB_KpnM-VAC36]|nr:hypothetical protein [Klebsiella phage vB_KpnM-VAC36]